MGCLHGVSRVAGRAVRRLAVTLLIASAVHAGSILCKLVNGQTGFEAFHEYRIPMTAITEIRDLQRVGTADKAPTWIHRLVRILFLWITTVTVGAAQARPQVHILRKQLHREGQLNTDFKEMPLSVLYKVPCHLKVQNIVKEPVELLKLIPGLSVVNVNATCCGMGGSYGMKKVNYDMAVEMAANLWEEVKAAHPDKAVTDCGGCRLQIEAGTGVATVHPLVLLQEAYQAS